MDEIFVHENFTTSGDKANDIALLRLGEHFHKDLKDKEQLQQDLKDKDQYLQDLKDKELFLPDQVSNSILGMKTIFKFNKRLYHVITKLNNIESDYDLVGWQDDRKLFRRLTVCFI